MDAIGYEPCGNITAFVAADQSNHLSVAMLPTTQNDTYQGFLLVYEDSDYEVQFRAAQATSTTCIWQSLRSPLNQTDLISSAFSPITMLLTSFFSMTFMMNLRSENRNTTMLPLTLEVDRQPNRTISGPMFFKGGWIKDLVHSGNDNDLANTRLN